MKQNKGFTLIELLTVIGVIALLAAILIPTVGRVRDSAKQTQTRAQFSQWITAIEMFRTEYGHWPDFNSRAGEWDAVPLEDNNVVVRLSDPENRRNFFEFLSGRKPDGTQFDNPNRYNRHPNRRRISFYDFTESDYRLTDSSGNINPTASNVELVDSFGNTDIVIVMDGNRNGIISLKDEATYRVQSSEGPSLPRVAPYSPLEGDGPLGYTGDSRQVRASVIIYSPGKGASEDSEARRNMIRSW
jgi:prepilin-type N-terminal cleavage/methylation domain-containing protein